MAQSQYPALNLPNKNHSCHKCQDTNSYLINWTNCHPECQLLCFYCLFDKTSFRDRLCSDWLLFELKKHLKFMLIVDFKFMILCCLSFCLLYCWFALRWMLLRFHSQFCFCLFLLYRPCRLHPLCLRSFDCLCQCQTVKIYLNTNSVRFCLNSK